tara:strand:- start:308 stop:445 length:138 start_codon:yes stop_codon:yes gene_type:complete
MPVYLRRFYIGKLVSIKKEEKKEMDKSSKSSKGISRPNISKPSGR